MKLSLAALIAVLVAVALPVVSVQREHARRARCLRNMHAIWEGMMLYASDNNGTLPVLSPLIEGSRREGEKGFNRHAMLLLSKGYVRSPAMFVCPSDKEDGDPMRPLSDDGSTGHARVRVGDPANLLWFNISYVYVAGLTVRDPGKFLVLADEHWDSEGDCPAECPHDLDAFDNHGRTGRNVLFLDGRGQWLPGPKLDDAYRPIRDGKADYRTRTVD
jgi:prepilin-type processing-associated H-X9-DG protein